VDRKNSDFDIRHSFTAGVTYDLPAPGAQKFVRAAFGGWSLDSFVLARSAPPVDLVGSIYFASGTALASRPNVTPGVPLVLYGPQYPGGKIFNKAAFTLPPKGTQGDFARNVLRGFGATQADLALQRQFHLTEKMGLRFRSEFFNIFNHPNFGNPNNNLTSPSSVNRRKRWPAAWAPAAPMVASTPSTKSAVPAPSSLPSSSNFEMPGY